MKRCPECRRDYYDDTLLYCLDDGNALLEGPASADEPVTAILSEPGAIGGGFRPNEAQTRPHIITADQAAIFPREAKAEPQESLSTPSEKQSLSAHRAAEPQRGRNKLFAVFGAAVLLVAGGFFGFRYFKPAASEQINSIAVLPFENRSGSADTDYLSDGLADSLIYRLSQLPNLKVSPTSSVMRYKGSATDVAQIARELEVDAVMSGRLVQRGDDLSISVQLIDSRTKKLIWAEQYDRKMADLLATQREIATEIAQNLKLKLSGEGEKALTKQYTSSNEAYQLHLKGRYHYAKRTKEDMQRAIEYFNQAIALDPNFALAFVGLADVYNSIPTFSYAAPKESIPKAKAAAMRSLEIDPTLADAHTALASSLSLLDWNWHEAEREFQKAFDLDKRNAGSNFRYGVYFLIPLGRSVEAIAQFKQGMELEPLSLVQGANFAAVYIYARQNELALSQARKTFDLEPNGVIGRIWLGNAYNANGMYPDAIALCEQSLQMYPANQSFLYTLGIAHAKAGHRQEAEKIISNWKELSIKEYAAHYYFASIYASLGERDKAFAELEIAFEQRDFFAPRLKVDPFMDPLRDDPRFAALVKRLNLP